MLGNSSDAGHDNSKWAVQICPGRNWQPGWDRQGQGRPLTFCTCQPLAPDAVSGSSLKLGHFAQGMGHLSTYSTGEFLRAVAGLWALPSADSLDTCSTDTVEASAESSQRSRLQRLPLCLGLSKHHT